MTETVFTDPYSGAIQSWSEASSFAYSEAQNITHGLTVGYTAFAPDRRIYWRYSIFYDNFHFYQQGTNLWDSWWWFESSGSPVSAEQVLNDWNPKTNYSKYVLNRGGILETHCFFYPRLVSSNFSEGFLYYPMSESLDHGSVTVVLATNATLYGYDISILFGVLTGFAYYGAPLEIAIIIGGIWWVLCLLAIVKLIVG